MRVTKDDIDIFHDDTFNSDMERQVAEAEAIACASAVGHQTHPQEQHETEMNAPVSDLGVSAKRVSSISAEKFRKVARSIVFYIRSQEDAASAAGVRQKDVIEWYLNQQEGVDNVDDLASERVLVKRIIARMVNVDNSLFVMQDGGVAASIYDWHLTVNPEFDP